MASPLNLHLLWLSGFQRGHINSKTLALVLNGITNVPGRVHFFVRAIVHIERWHGFRKYNEWIVSALM